jgi:hypothetical protein
MLQAGPTVDLLWEASSSALFFSTSTPMGVEYNALHLVGP